MNASKSSKPLRRKVEDCQLKKSVINKGSGQWGRICPGGLNKFGWEFFESKCQYLGRWHECRGLQGSGTQGGRQILSSVIFRKYHENHRKQREGMEGRKTHSVAVRLLTGQSQRTDNLRKKLYGIFHPTHKSLFCSFWTGFFFRACESPWVGLNLNGLNLYNIGHVWTMHI